jgi:hypothetical protein
MRYNLLSGNPFKKLYYRAGSLILLIKEIIFPPKNSDYKQIPIIINNFNRLESMTLLISALKERGYNNIHIIDNLSTYPPLLEYYKTCPYPVFRLGRNIGSNSFWLSGIYKHFYGEYFVFTDSDIVPMEECPEDFMLVFLNVLKKYRLARKVGFSLKIDDLPDSYALKEQVIGWEKQFFEKKCDEMLYLAPIDTTFALYRPRGSRRPANFSAEMYRTGFPYMARHLPWYVESLNPDEENRYYMEHSRSPTSWTSRGHDLIKGK